MAATTNIVDRGSAGDLFFRVVSVTLDNSYPSGGYAITPQQFGFGKNGTIVEVSVRLTSTGWLVSWDYPNAKLKVYDGSGAANVVMHEVAAATDLTAIVARLLVWGQGNG